jgi:hypothetical protein
VGKVNIKNISYLKVVIYFFKFPIIAKPTASQSKTQSGKWET